MQISIDQQRNFWDALAPHHAALENNYLDLASLRRLMGSLQSPALVVGAGQGLLVAELQSKGFRCDGVDFSPEMIRQAKSRRGLDLIHTDASAMPLGNGTYETVVCATGVIDFNADEEEIQRVLSEARRVTKPGGTILVGFYRFSPAMERFLRRTRLLIGYVLLHRRCLETYLLSPAEMIQWTMKEAHTDWLAAAALVLRLAVLGTIREKMTTLRMQKIIRRMTNPGAFIQSAPESQPYRNEAEIRNLFARLRVPIKDFRTLATCFVAQI